MNKSLTFIFGIAIGIFAGIGIDKIITPRVQCFCPKSALKTCEAELKYCKEDYKYVENKFVDIQYSLIKCERKHPDCGK